MYHLNKHSLYWIAMGVGRWSYCRLPERELVVVLILVVLLKTSLLGNWWQFSHSSTKLSTGYRSIKKVGRVPSQRLPLKFCAVRTRLLLVKLDWFHEVCCTIGISLISLKSTTAISLNQIDQIKTARTLFCKTRGEKKIVICRLGVWLQTLKFVI